MKPTKTDGFTIIEVMLFLAITAFLIMGILIGTGTSINTQRYRDSVSSLQSFFQEQYSEVSNVENDRSDTLSCNGVSNLGQSDCVILGKYIASDSGNSGSLVIKSVIGTIPPSQVVNNNNDVDVLKQYVIKISPVDSEVYDLEWGATLVNKEIDGKQPMYISMLILRSPSSGVIRTFMTSTTDPGQIVQDDDIGSSLLKQELLKSSNATTMCVDSNGMFTGARSAIVISPDATGSTGIEKLGAGGNNGC